MNTFQKGSGKNTLTFPMSREQMRALGPCDLVSVRIGRHHGIPMPPALCNDAGLHDALREVLKVREDVKAGTFPMWFMRKYYPSDWGEFPGVIPAPLAAAGETFNLPAPLSYDDPAGLAGVVHMDHTHDLARVLMDWLLDVRAAPPGAGGVGFDFLRAVPEQHRNVAAQIDKALEKAFEVKYYYGLPRPEEVAGEQITAYPEGCPNHPTFPAGHGAAAFASSEYFMREWGVSDEQKKELFDAAYVWSMARTFAGVHFAVDNLPFAPRRAEV